VIFFVRLGAGVCAGADTLAGATLRHGDAGKPEALARDGLRGERLDALVSCLASRTGAPGGCVGP